MEDDLDQIAAGDEERSAGCSRFYFGENGGAGLKQQVDRTSPRSTRARSTRSRSATGHRRRVGRYGPYLERGEERQRFAETRARRADRREARELLAPEPASTRARHRPGHRPRDRSQVRPLRAVRDRVVEGGEKPRTASLFKSMSPETVTLDEALRLLTLPRTVGDGRRRGGHRHERPLRPVRQEGQGVALARQRGGALHDHARGGPGPAGPAEGSGPRQAAPPLKELGDDPVSGKPIVLKEGRFGPYVTDGETQRQPARRGLDRVDHARAGRRADPGSP